MSWAARGEWLLQSPSIAAEALHGIEGCEPCLQAKSLA